jgi:mono/diheme cytochrome c family protein
MNCVRFLVSQSRVTSGWVWIAGCTLLWLGCKHEVPTPPVIDNPVVVDPPCDPNVVYFAQDIQPLLAAACAQPACHDAANPAEGIRLDSYSGLMNSPESHLVVAGNPGASELIEVLLETDPDKVMPPPPASPLTAAQIDLIAAWIEQGALNLSCEECDNTTVTYSADIAPLIANRCATCHSGNAPSGSLRLTQHSEVVAAVQNRNLMQCVERLTGFSAMPPSGALSDCELEKLQIWVADNMPNN